MNVQHSSRSDRWFTPVPILSMVRDVLGTIDLDPASEEQANLRVLAKRIITREQNGLHEDWGTGSVFCNPPGGKQGRDSLTFLFWKRMMVHRETGNLTHGIFMCFSLEALQSTQGKGVRPIGSFPFCVPSKRIRFDFPAGNSGDAPSHSNAIVYVPGTINFSRHFKEIFGTMGIVIGA